MSLDLDASDYPSPQRQRGLKGRETFVVASGAVLSLILGALVQVVFPPAPQTLIVLAESGVASAESFGDISLAVDYE